MTGAANGDAPPPAGDAGARWPAGSRPAPPDDERCDWCGADDSWWRNCKLLCRNCGAIVKSCADL